MQGPAPTIHAPGRWSPNTGSFGDPRGLTLSYYCHFGADQVTDGYAKPVWNGYTMADQCLVVTDKGDSLTEPAKPSFDLTADEDGDGFTNGEEIEAGTDPLDPDSHPAPPSPAPVPTTPAPAPTATSTAAPDPTDNPTPAPSATAPATSAAPAPDPAASASTVVTPGATAPQPANPVRPGLPRTGGAIS